MKFIERLKFFLLDLMSFLAVMIFIASIAFIWYGLETQCPDVAIYEYCGK
jgi:hypothetical protein